MREETRKLISRADKDLSTAGFATQSRDGPLPVTTGLHCQSSVENYLKAFLLDNEIPFSEYQRLNTLFEYCISADPSFTALRNEIDQLASYSIASRYPKADDSVKFRDEAVNAAKRVKEFILKKLS